MVEQDLTFDCSSSFSLLLYYFYNGGNLASTLALSLLIGSSSFLQVTRKTTKVWMSSNFGRIPPLTSELAALERLKK